MKLCAECKRRLDAIWMISKRRVLCLDCWSGESIERQLLLNSLPMEVEVIEPPLGYSGVAAKNPAIAETIVESAYRSIDYYMGPEN